MEKIQKLESALIELQKRVYGIETAHQTLLTILFNKSPDAKIIAIEVLSAIINENKGKNDPITKAFRESLSRIQSKDPLSPEEMRKRLFVVEKHKKAE